MTKKQLIKLYELLCLAEAELESKCQISMAAYIANLLDRQSILVLKESINRTLENIKLKKIRPRTLTEEEKKKYYTPLIKNFND